MTLSRGDCTTKHRCLRVAAADNRLQPAEQWIGRRGHSNMSVPVHHMLNSRSMVGLWCPAVAEIKQNRNDQALAVLELGATLLLQICTPAQAAAIVARAYPLHVQPRAIAAAVARKHAAEQRATSTC